MSIITAIKQQKVKNRVNVYLDGKFGFGIDLDNFVKLNLRVEQEMAEEEIKKIVHTAEFQKTLDKLLRFATLRPRSQKEITSWFNRKDVPESLREDLFAKLFKLELVDDTKFAQWWVEQRGTFRPKPKRILEGELRLKGIRKEIIDAVLDNAVVDEEKLARTLLETKAYKWTHLDSAVARRKKSEFLARKGFDWDVIKRVI